jgi:hypothetical protein
MFRILGVVVLLVIGIAPREARAWNFCGHLTVAQIAYMGLEPATKSRVIADLKAMKAITYGSGESASNLHDLLMKGLPPGADADLYLFTRASTWPDLARAVGFKDRFHHGTWHYVHWAVGPKASNVPAPNDDPAFRPANLEDMSILQALDHNLTAAAGGAKPEDRGLALCWVMHLVGDIHQPHHAATLYSDEFPAGDQGATHFMVRRTATSPQNEKLHLLWDALLGNSEAPATVDHLANALVTIRPREAFTAAELACRDYKAWALESKALAIRLGYLDFTLRGCRLLQPGDTGRGCLELAADAPVLPDGYLEAATSVAERRVTLAGYRLAGLLNEGLK